MATTNHQQPKTPIIVEQIVTQPRTWPKLLTIDSANVANPSFRWRVGSRFVVPSVGLFSKFWMNLANSSTVYHAAVLYEALNQNYLASRSMRTWFSNSGKSTLEHRPLITYSNHQSCLDDPLMWGALLPLRWQFNSDRHRWSSAAAEVCFSKKWHSIFFSLGKTFPIIRGEGIYQPAMDYAAKLMKAGQWLHFFPEGKVIPKPENSDPELLQFRFDENGRPIDLKRFRDGDGDDERINNERKEISFTDSFFKSKLSSTTATLVANYSLKWGLARLIIEHVLGEGSANDNEYYDRFHDSSDCENLSTSTLSLSSSNSVDSYITDFGDCGKNVLPEVDVLPIYHVGMDDVLPTKKPYVPRMFQKVTFLVRPEGPIRIDRAFLQRLFSDESSASSSSSSSSSSGTRTEMVAIPERQQSIASLSLTEKRIRLMQYLEEELNRLRDKAVWLHDRFNEQRTTLNLIEEEEK